MAALGVSLYALYGAQKLCHAAHITMKTAREECAAAIEAAQTQYTVMAADPGIGTAAAGGRDIAGNPKPA